MQIRYPNRTDFMAPNMQTFHGKVLQAGRVAHQNFFVFLRTQVRDCRLVSLLDLALEKDYVRSKVAEYMNHLIDIGVAGFRIDAAKHMWPGDVKAILDQLKDLNTKWFSAGTKPFIYQEVILILHFV